MKPMSCHPAGAGVAIAKNDSDMEDGERFTHAVSRNEKLCSCLGIQHGSSSKECGIMHR